MREISAMKVWLLPLYLVCVLCQSALIKSNCYFLIYSSLTKLNMEARDWLYQTKMHISLIAYEDNYQSIPPYFMALQILISNVWVWRKSSDACMNFHQRFTIPGKVYCPWVLMKNLNLTSKFFTLFIALL